MLQANAMQAGNFFRAYHASVTEALLSMLRKELWQRLPPGAEGAAHACALSTSCA